MHLHRSLHLAGFFGACVLVATACSDHPTTTPARPAIGGLVKTDQPPGYTGYVALCKIGPVSTTPYTVHVSTATSGGQFFLTTLTGDFPLTVAEGQAECKGGAFTMALFTYGSSVHLVLDETSLPAGTEVVGWQLFTDQTTPVLITSQSGSEFDYNILPNTGYKLVLTNRTKVMGKGCTPGYWKQEQHFDSWPDAYHTSDHISAYFTPSYGFGSNTLLEALSFSGGPGVDGGAKILLRASVAALLNSAALTYPESSADVIAMVNEALASGDRATMLSVASLLDGYNNLGCPLN